MSRLCSFLLAGLAVAVSLALCASATADLLPTHGAAVHYDPLPPPAYFPAVPGGAILPAGWDGLPAPNQPWHWEIELHNPGPGALPPYPIRINVPDGRVIIGMILVHAPGVSLLFDIHFNEAALLGGDTSPPDFATVVTPGPATPGALETGASVTEDFARPDETPPEFKPDPNVKDPLVIKFEKQIGPIREIPEFTGDASEDFTGPQVVFTPCVVPPLPDLFGSEDNNLCTPNASGCSTTPRWDFRCEISARSAPYFFGSADGWVRYTFDPPIARFGGYFGSNAAFRGENNDAEVRFRDEDGNDLGTGVAKVGDGDCLWHWNGWESTGAPIAEIDVVGKLFGGAFIDMDDMEIAAGPEIDCDAITRFKAKCRRNKLKGMIKRSTLPEGTQLTLLNNGGDAKVVNINRRGKGKAKWTRQAGKHEVTIEECPNIPGKSADCGE